MTRRKREQMQYSRVKEGVFLSRPNRFIAEIEIGGQREICHVKNTGRCRELLIPGTRVWVQEAAGKERKTKYDLITVEKPGLGLVNLDSQAPNKAVGEWLAAGGLGVSLTCIRPEYRYGSSRIDFYGEWEKQAFLMEVKGVTLEEGGTARFPDAPSERAVKHIRELQEAKEKGMEAYALFVIQMKGVTEFRPNDRTHPAFGEALREAERTGVRLLARDCLVTEDSIRIHRPVPVITSADE